VARALINCERNGGEGHGYGVTDSAIVDVLYDAIGELFLLRTARHVLERQHSNRRLVEKR